MTTAKNIISAINSYFVFYLVFILTTVSANIRSLSFKQRKDCLINADQICLDVAVRSKQECVVSATSSGHITSSWNAATSTCKVSDIDTTHDSKALIYCGFIPGWTTFTQKRYPVFNARGPNGVYATMTFPQAETLCQEYGTTLASPGDLLDAKGMGFEECLCGWLSDGLNGFVMQTLPRDFYCWDVNVEGINYCNHDLADAYCLFK